MEQTLQPGQIIILNGAPRAGKSSIVAEIQTTFEDVWMNLGVDQFMRCTPQRYQPAIGLRPGGESPDLEPLIVVLYRALYDCIAAHSRLGLNVVVDVGHHDAYAIPRGILYDSARRLAGLPVVFVGVRCSLENILERRERTGYVAEDAPNSPILLWQREVHIPGIYDLEVDTSLLSPRACTEVIREHLSQEASPSAFQRLAGMVVPQGDDLV